MFNPLGQCHKSDGTRRRQSAEVQRGIYRQTHVQNYSCTSIDYSGQADQASDHAKHGKITCTKATGLSITCVCHTRNVSHRCNESTRACFLLHEDRVMLAYPTP